MDVKTKMCVWAVERWRRQLKLSQAESIYLFYWSPGYIWCREGWHPLKDSTHVSGKTPPPRLLCGTRVSSVSCELYIRTKLTAVLLWVEPPSGQDICVHIYMGSPPAAECVGVACVWVSQGCVQSEARHTQVGSLQLPFSRSRSAAGCVCVNDNTKKKRKKK